jgi:hypothetical protein
VKSNIDGVVLKVLRAKQHLNDFHRTLTDFIDRGPYYVVDGTPFVGPPAMSLRVGVGCPSSF